MSDKTKTSGQSEAAASTAASTTQQQATPQAQNGAAGTQAANMWNYHMYNMYGMYNMNMYPNYNHPYYQMLASQGYGTSTTGYQQTNTSNSPQMVAMDAYRSSFTSGGTLMPFNANNTQSASPTTGTTTNTTVDISTHTALTAATTTKVEEIELPPLPPGPPPPSVPPPPPPAAPSPPPLPPTDATQAAALQQSPSVQACMTSPYAHYMAYNQSLYQQQLNKSYQQQQQSPQQTHQQNQYQTSKQQFNQTPQQQFNQTPQQQQQGQYNFLYPPPTISGNQQQSANNQQQPSYGQTPNSGQQQNKNYGQQTPVQQQNQNYGQSPASQKQNQNYGQSSGSRWDGGGGNTSKPEKETRWSQPNQQGPRFNQPNNNRNSRFNNNQQQQDGPIRFNMNRPRGRMNNANKAPLLSNPDWMSGKTKWQGNQNKPGQQQQQGGPSGKEKPMGSSQETGPTLSDEETLRKLVDGWPDNLKAYVDRCFSDCPPDKKDKLVVVLKSQLIKAANNGSLWCKQWQCEPMPMLEDDEQQTPKKSGRMDTRMGYLDSQGKSPNKKKKKDRRSRGRSSSESSQSSQDGGYIEFSSSATSKKKKNKDKKKNKFKHNIEESHYWNEFGMNGGKVETKKEVLDKRAARFNNDKGGTNKLQAKVKPAPARMSTTSRFNQQHSSGQNSPYRQHQQQSMDSFAMDIDTDFDISTCHIVGTCRDIEKPYLRLTTAPEPCQVRPPEVLKESLEFVKKKWVEKGDYRYVCEQLKSIRQDLTVQGIRDSFTVLVYETHAKIALETSDHAEFNQCQSQLNMLHKEHNSPNRYEFTAYRLLYFIFTQDFMDVNTMLMSLSMEEKNNECISHAVSVMKAWLSSNFDKLLRLYSTCPRMSGSLMDWFIGRERKNALKIIIKAYRPTIPTLLLQSRLAFKSEENLVEFLKPLDLIYTDSTKKTIDCKLSTTALQA